MIQIIFRLILGRKVFGLGVNAGKPFRILTTKFTKGHKGQENRSFLCVASCPLW